MIPEVIENVRLENDHQPHDWWDASDELIYCLLE
jgi:hypothetical protein